MPQVRAAIDWSQVSVQGVRVHAPTPLLPAPNAASGVGSLGDSAGFSSSRWQTSAGTKRLLGGSRDTCYNTGLTASVPLTMIPTEARSDIQEGERLRARLLRQERDRGDLFVVDTERDRGDLFVVDSLTRAGGGDKHGAVKEGKKLNAGDSPTSSVPAPPVFAPARPAAVEWQEGSGGGEGWEGGHILQGALRALGWPSSPQVSRLERVVEQELLAQYTL